MGLEVTPSDRLVGLSLDVLALNHSHPVLMSLGEV